MFNHIHLIVNPSEKVENLVLLIKRVFGRQTRYMNKLESRRGTICEGCYKSSQIDKYSYLIAYCRYVEFNPVRAKIADDIGGSRG